ncbi:MAG TPA: hypothetical protein VGY54_04760 [Polyangiaceae bacterium]|nr:hypothetical protein [Polyangiaceae bacterium]
MVRPRRPRIAVWLAVANCGQSADIRTERLLALVLRVQKPLLKVALCLCCPLVTSRVSLGYLSGSFSVAAVPLQVGRATLTFQLIVSPVRNYGSFVRKVATSVGQRVPSAGKRPDSEFIHVVSTVVEECIAAARTLKMLAEVLVLRRNLRGPFSPAGH